MSQIAVPCPRPDTVPAPDTVQAPDDYTGRHRLPDTRARDLQELEGTTRDLQSPAGLVAAARAVMGLLR